MYDMTKYQKTVMWFCVTSFIAKRDPIPQGKTLKMNCN